MEDTNSYHDDVTQRVLDMVKIFLAASKRGDNTFLILESRKQHIFIKYRSVETETRSTVMTSPSTAKQNSRKR